jgi:hypothetical protein
MVEQGHLAGPVGRSVRRSVRLMSKLTLLTAQDRRSAEILTCRSGMSVPGRRRKPGPLDRFEVFRSARETIRYKFTVAISTTP